MKRLHRWLIPFAVLGLMACNLGSAASTLTPTAGLSFPTTTPLPSETPPPSETPAPTATAIPTEIPGGQAVPGCDIRWFFTFRPGLTEPGCPERPVVVDAVGEDFTGGRVYRYAPVPGEASGQGTLFVIYNNGTWETRVDDFKPGDPQTDPSITPPSGKTQPAGAIGKLWRENQSIRSVLGWAFGPEQPFAGRYQNPQNDNFNIFLDHGKGLVLRLNTTASGYRSWKVVGDY